MSSTLFETGRAGDSRPAVKATTNLDDFGLVRPDSYRDTRYAEIVFDDPKLTALSDRELDRLHFSRVM
jgi:hypothetical protein